MSANTRNPAQGGASWIGAGGRPFHVDHASAVPLLQRLEGVRPYGGGWRAKCPACGGRSQKLVVTEATGKVLIHCFGGCEARAVIESVGLTWAELFPPRHWPESRDERRAMRQAMRSTGWASALEVLAMEAAVVHVAAAQLMKDESLNWDDYQRLVQAFERIGSAASIMTEGHKNG